MKLITNVEIKQLVRQRPKVALAIYELLLALARKGADR